MVVVVAKNAGTISACSGKSERRLDEIKAGPGRRRKLV